MLGSVIFTQKSLFGGRNDSLYIASLNLLWRLRHMVYISGIHLMNKNVWTQTAVRKTLRATQKMVKCSWTRYVAVSIQVKSAVHGMDWLHWRRAESYVSFTCVPNVKRALCRKKSICVADWKSKVLLAGNGLSSWEQTARWSVNWWGNVCLPFTHAQASLCYSSSVKKDPNTCTGCNKTERYLR
jgi:hypothetical protein